MITFNPAFMGNPNVKTLERVAKCKNGSNFINLSLKSEGTKAYNMKVKVLNEKNEVKGLYEEAFGGVENRPNEFKDWAECAVEKIRKACDDPKLIEDLKDFFRKIAQ